jgi:O-acetyl-ADP-ribose deacetylase (regulator of RNase III)
MIKIVDGDLLEATEDIIGHQVNCQAKMRSGVAKAVREKYPRAYDDYMYSFRTMTPEQLLGACLVTYVAKNKYVANLYGQFNYGYDGKQYTDGIALAKALTELKFFAEERGLSVALPYKIGSDRGGADWNEVYKMIDTIFHDYEVTLYRLQV